MKGVSPLGSLSLRNGKENSMIDMISHLWNIMTIFFTEKVIYNPLFMGMLLFVLIFYVIYFLIGLLTPDNWIHRY